MRDYSKKIEELNFLKHYLLLENEIEAKYTGDQIKHYPMTEHNIDALNARLRRQLLQIKEKYLPDLEKLQRNCVGSIKKCSIGLGISSAYFILTGDMKSIGIPLLMFVPIIFLDGIDYFRFQREIDDIKDMEYVDENEVVIENTDLPLSELAREELAQNNVVSLNNIDCFTRRDMQKIKKYHAARA